ncbi:MAG: hypothetical protein ACAI35_08560 [Candidatus Methylacidiphilales bacterium]|nr:hypothetical protein [Candidatus Methylacidiphilales bacterium]
MNLFSSHGQNDGESGMFDQRENRAALQARVKTWVREVLNLDDSVGITVNELRCPEPDCPDLETVIGVLLTEPRRINKYKVTKALQDMTREDVASACASGT